MSKSLLPHVAIATHEKLSLSTNNKMKTNDNNNNSNSDSSCMNEMLVWVGLDFTIISS